MFKVDIKKLREIEFKTAKTENIFCFVVVIH